MDLHKDKENFDIVVRATSRFFNVSPSIIEKYYEKILKNFYLKKLVTRKL